MKILFFGHNGWIGNKICNFLKNTNNTIYCSNARANCVEDVEDEIIKLNPTHIISTIGRTSGPNITGQTKINTIDYLEQPGKMLENVRDNLFSPLILAIL